MSKIAIKYFETISQYFLRKGKKSVMEKLFKNLLFKRAKENKSKINPLLETCFHSAIPYIKLKSRTKRRGKRTIYRLTFLERKKAERLSFAAFSKQVSAKKSDRFVPKIEAEIESFGTNKNHPLRLQRDKIHRIGLNTIKKIVKNKKFTGLKKKKKRVKVKLKLKKQLNNL